MELKKVDLEDYSLKLSAVGSEKPQFSGPFEGENGPGGLGFDVVEGVENLGRASSGPWSLVGTYNKQRGFFNQLPLEGGQVCGCAEGVIPEFWRPQTVSHPRCGAGEKTRLLSSKRSLRLIHRLRFSVRGSSQIFRYELSSSGVSWQSSVLSERADSPIRLASGLGEASLGRVSCPSTKMVLFGSLLGCIGELGEGRERGFGLSWGLWDDSWCVGGGFNIIRFPRECNKGERLTAAMRRFLDFFF
ncbi:hypothetical protein AAG906_016631 [Vitis piasezkii]